MAAVFLSGADAHRVDLLVDMTSAELTVATHAALQVDNVISVADGADALGGLIALCAACGSLCGDG